MYFGLDRNSRELVGGLIEVLDDACPPSLVREQWVAGDGGMPAGVAALWETLTDLGLGLVLLPEDQGGIGLDEIALAGMMRVVGSFAVPAPVLERAVLAPVLAASTVEHIEPDAVVAWAPDCRLAPWGGQADLVVVGGSDGHELSFAKLDSASLGQNRSLDRGRPLHPVGPATDRLVAHPDVRDRLWQRAVLAASAELVGLSERMQQMSTEHVAEREQFGRPVGANQAVKHLLADAQVAIEFARPLVLQAAWRLKSGDSRAGRAVSMAKARSGRVAEQVARAAFQCHGGMGYTTEHDLHMFAKRAWAIASSFGATEVHDRRLVGAMPREARLWDSDVDSKGEGQIDGNR